MISFICPLCGNHPLGEGNAYPYKCEACGNSFIILIKKPKRR